MMMQAYIYARWSSLEQTKGSTLPRQIDNCTRLIEQRGWSIADTIIDRGRSAYTGANIQTGELGRFAERVRSGQIINPILVVEELDRLSRQPADIMLTWLSPLVRQGLTIIVTQTGQTIDAAMLDHDMGGLMMLLITAFGSHKESAKKSERVGKAWDAKREAARAGQKVQRNHRHPMWIEVLKDGEMRAIPERQAIVERIFRERLSGAGKMMIAKGLNADRVPTWAATKKAASIWTATYIGRIITNRAVMGEWQPHSFPRGGVRTPVGEPITDYYPQIITPDVFARANDKRAENQRKHQGRGRSISNLLGVRARCGECGGQMSALGSARYRTNKDGSKTRHYFLYCANAKIAETCTNQVGWTYDRVEGPLLDHVLTLAMDDQHFAAKDEAASIDAEVLAIKGTLANVETRMSRLLVLVEDGDENAVARYSQLRAERDDARAALEDAENRLAEARGKTSPDEHLRRVAEVRAMMTSDDEDERFQARMRVKEALHDLIESIRFYPAQKSALVVLVDKARAFTIEHDGTNRNDLDFLKLSPHLFEGGTEPPATVVENGVTTIVGELDSDQKAAAMAYRRRHAVNQT